MNVTLKAGLASAALAAAAAAAGPVAAADLHGRGSLKDYAPLPQIVRGPAGPCYVRADVGYSMSGEPDVTWPATIGNTTTTYFAGGGQQDLYDRVLTSEKVSNVEMDDAWLGEAGVGCGSGSRGFRVEAVLGIRGDRDITGTTGAFGSTDTVIVEAGAPGVPRAEAADVVGTARMHSSLRTYTGMINVFADLGNWRGVVPYVGAGIGAAYHDLDDLHFTGYPATLNVNKGNTDLAFAWAVMAGFGYQVSERTIVDFGYRYIDLGKIEAQRIDSGGFANPRFKFDDITAHEFKVGLRYHFGGHQDCCAAPVHMPLK